MSKTLIAIPTYNAEEFISRTLQSCVNQTLKTEILVVDNCSTDETQQIIKKLQEQYDNIRLVVNEKNLGRVGNWNRCLDLFDQTLHEYIKFVFTGDELLPLCIEEVERVFTENEGLSVVVWPYLYVVLNDSRSVERVYNGNRRFNKNELVAEGFFPSNVTNGIIGHSYAKSAIQNNRFHDIFLGGHTFCNEVVLWGDVYYLDKVLSVFNLDAHMSFDKQFNYFYALEYSYTMALGLEKTKGWIPEKRYLEIRDDIILSSFLRQIEYYGYSLIAKLIKKWFYNIAVGVMRFPQKAYKSKRLRKTIRNKVKNILQRIGVCEPFIRWFNFRHMLYKPRLNNLVLYANSFCNARCPMCDVAVGAGEGIARPLKDASKFLTLSLLDKILNDELIAGRRIYINFLMTEPLLAPELPKMLAMCKQWGHTVKITTNGFLLAKRAEEISPYVDNVQLSLDGLEEMHDSIRGKGFFAAGIKGIRALREINDKVEIEINCTISNINYLCLLDFLKQIDSFEIRINLLKFQLLDFVSKSMRDRHNTNLPDIPQGTSSLGSSINVDKVDIMELQNQLQSVRNYKPSFIQQIAFKPSLKNTELLKTYFDPAGDPIPGSDRCITPWCALAINTDGKVFWHVRCFNDYILGDVSRDNLRSIFFGEKAEYFRKQLKKKNFCFPACSRCCGVMSME